MASLFARRFLVTALTLVSLLMITAWSRESHAYPWMIRHEYTGCAVCHTDPSGGFLLTQYGRAQTQTLLSTFGRGPAGEEVDRRSQFAFGVPLPDWLNVGVTGRYMYLYMKPKGVPGSGESVWMQSDARAVVTVDRVEVAGSIGYSHEGGLPAAITSRPKDNVVAREFWVGYSFDEDRNNRLRVGRMYVPFGMRTMEHTLFVRNVTQTDLDSQQQWGASFFHQGEAYRAEVMAVLGNYQMRPDSYRRRGYSAYLEYAVMPRMGVGFSSFATYQKTDDLHLVAGSLIRGAHGPYLRWAPIPSLALLSEWDLVHSFATQGGDPIFGLVGLVQADWEFVRGLHAVVTPELYVPQFGGTNSSTGYRGWLTMAWYAYPHIDLRADAVVANEPNAGKYTMALGQVHVSL